MHPPSGSFTSCPKLPCLKTAHIREAAAHNLKAVLDLVKTVVGIIDLSAQICDTRIGCALIRA